MPALRNFKQKKQTPAPLEYPLFLTETNLSPETDWFDATFHQQQILVLGKKGNQLILARCDGMGVVEFIELGNFVEGTKWLNAPRNTQDLLIFWTDSTIIMPIKPIVLESNPTFSQSITLHFVNWLPKMTYGVCMCDEGRVAVVYCQEQPKAETAWWHSYALVLGLFQPDGRLLTQRDLIETTKNKPVLRRGLPPRYLIPIVPKDGFLFVPDDHNWLIINIETGMTQNIEWMFNERSIAVYSTSPKLFFVSPRVTEAYGNLYFQRYKKETLIDDDSDYFGEEPPKKASDKLCGIGHLNDLFLAIFEDRTDFYDGIFSEDTPQLVLKMPFKEKAIKGFTLGRESGLFAILTDGKKVLVYEFSK